MGSVNKLMLGGYPVILDRATGWFTSSGSTKDPALFMMDPKDAEALLRTPTFQFPVGANATTTVERNPGPQAKGISLVFERPSGERHEFKNLFVVGEGRPPTAISREMLAGTRSRRAVMVSDQRYFWKNKHVVGRYNMRRVSGARRFISPSGTPLGIVQVENDVAFSQLSLRGPNRKWTAIEVVKDVLSRVVGIEGADWEIRGNPTNFLLVQDIEINEPASTAVAKAVSLLAGYDLYQDKEGKIIVASQIPGDADKVIESLGPPLIIGQRIERVDQSTKRASGFKNLVTRELGVRFKFSESSVGGLSSVDTLDDNEPWLKNVFRTTDVATALSTGTVPQGTYADRDIVLAAWQATVQAIVGGGIAANFARDPLSANNIRRFFISQMSTVWARLGDLSGNPNEIVDAYIHEIGRSFRQTFIMNPKYSGAALRIIPKDPGILDPETGAERASPVFVDHSIKPSLLNVAKDRLKRPYLYNRTDGTTADTFGIPARSSSFDLVMLNPELGIFKIVGRETPGGLEDRVIPSAITDASLPRADHTAAAVNASIDLAELKPNHKMSVIVTLVPGLPNDDRQYHVIDTPLVEVEKILGRPLGVCLAPVMEQLVGAGLATAKFPHTPGKEEDIKRALGIVAGKPLLGDPINKADLEALSLSNAVAYYVVHMDHYAGNKTIPMRSDVEPVGEISSVFHFMSADGGLFTTVSCGVTNYDLFNPLAVLPESARRTLLRSANPIGS